MAEKTDSSSLRIAVLTVSDRAAAGEMTDLGGPAVEEELAAVGLQTAERKIVADERDQITAYLKQWADEGMDVIFTTGGTGLSARDITPEVTAEVCTRLIPGIGEAMRAAGLQHTQFAMLSRALAGVRGNTLIINLPGSPRGAAEGVQVVAPILQHAVVTLHGGRHSG